MRNKFLNIGQPDYHVLRKVKVYLSSFHYAVVYDFSVAYKCVLFDFIGYRSALDSFFSAPSAFCPWRRVHIFFTTFKPGFLVRLVACGVLNALPSNFCH